ncbi:MAG: site-specific DNA-methyltransferase [Candidatus Nanoarchaeia archaeon]|jgi:modification methylase|nr:site-specific DNA-methyltransferase [Candidatus Nanoarchaeia archaeon]
MINKLLLGNNLDILKTFNNDFIDCTITSPPYNKGENKNSGGILKGIKYDSSSDNIPEEEYQNQQVQLINELYRITKPGGHLFYNHKIRYIDGKSIFPILWLNKTVWSIRQEIIWDKKSAINVRGWRFHVVDERIYWLYKPIDNNDRGKELTQISAKNSSIWRFDPETKNQSETEQKHPAPFPIELPKRILLSLYNNDNKLILDPYIGSGTTAIAAKMYNHNYIGIDISETYIRIAQKRLDNTKAENICTFSQMIE